MFTAQLFIVLPIFLLSYNSSSSYQFHSSIAVYKHFPVQNIIQLHVTIDSFLYIQSDFNASTIQSFISVIYFCLYLSTTLGYFYLLLQLYGAISGIFISLSQVYICSLFWLSLKYNFLVFNLLPRDILTTFPSIFSYQSSYMLLSLYGHS